jgi:hypothetical protein
VDWNTARLPNGQHTLRISAYDAGARLLREWTRTVRVANAGARAPTADGGAVRRRPRRLLAC